MTKLATRKESAISLLHSALNALLFVGRNIAGRIVSHASPDPVSSDGRLSRKSTGSPMARVHKFPAVTRMERTCPQPPRQDAVRLSVLRPPFSPALFSGVPLDKGGWNKPVESALVAPGGTTWVERIWTNRHFPLILLGLFIPVA